MEPKLVEPSEKYIKRIEGSKHFLNCPKHMLNYALDAMYRQGVVQNKDVAIQYISDYLKRHEITEPKTKAIEFFEWRNQIKLSEFDKINVNSYVENTPPYITKMLNKQSEWVKNNTTYYPFTGTIKNIPSYPYKYYF